MLHETWIMFPKSAPSTIIYRRGYTEHSANCLFILNEVTLTCKGVLLSTSLCLLTCDILLQHNNLRSLHCDNVYMYVCMYMCVCVRQRLVFHICVLVVEYVLHDGICSVCDGLVIIVLLDGCLLVGGGGVESGFATAEDCAGSVWISKSNVFNS